MARAPRHRTRLRQAPASAEDAAEGAHRIPLRGTIEREGEDRPATIAETIRMSFP